jgi:CxxC motif-containing protein (DUF1111 family)
VDTTPHDFVDEQVHCEGAILWHGGEAARARDRFVALPREMRGALVAFLSTL